MLSIIGFFLWGQISPNVNFFIKKIHNIPILLKKIAKFPKSKREKGFYLFIWASFGL
jgi:hypothetical protein